MKQVIFTFLAGIMAANACGQDIFAYNDKVANRDNIGIFAGLAFNSTNNLIQQEFGYSFTAAGALSTVPSFGAFFQKGLGQRLSLRGSVMLGYASYTYKYGQAFDSLTDNFTPVLTKDFDKYTRVKHGSGFVMPQIDIGYLFGPFKKIYLIEARAGVGLHAYLRQGGTDTIIAGGKVTDPKNRYTYTYSSMETAKYGGPEAWGSLVTNIYVGVRWSQTTSEFLNRSALGLQATLPVYTDDIGYAQIEYRNERETFTKEKIQLGLFNIGIRFTYTFL